MLVLLLLASPHPKSNLVYTPSMPTDQNVLAVYRKGKPTLVFKIDIETCEQCGGAVRVIACIENPVVIKQILDSLENRTESPQPASHPVRAQPAHPELD